jgi:hypothetical protein
MSKAEHYLVTILQYTTLLLIGTVSYTLIKTKILMSKYSHVRLLHNNINSSHSYICSLTITLMINITGHIVPYT